MHNLLGDRLAGIGEEVFRVVNTEIGGHRNGGTFHAFFTVITIMISGIRCHVGRSDTNRLSMVSTFHIFRCSIPTTFSGFIIP